MQAILSGLNITVLKHEADKKSRNFKTGTSLKAWIVLIGLTTWPWAGASIWNSQCMPAISVMHAGLNMMVRHRPKSIRLKSQNQAYTSWTAGQFLVNFVNDCIIKWALYRYNGGRRCMCPPPPIQYKRFCTYIIVLMCSNLTFQLWQLLSLNLLFF